jgi:hypothetical protein
LWRTELAVKGTPKCTPLTAALGEKAVDAVVSARIPRGVRTQHGWRKHRQDDFNFGDREKPYAAKRW